MRLITVLITGPILISAAGAPSLAQRERVRVQPLFTCYEAVPGQPFKSPNGIFYYAKRQEIYVTDSGSHGISIFDNKGGAKGRIPHFVDKRSGSGRVEGEPRGVAVNSKGDIFVTDNLAEYVDVLDYRGRSVRRIYAADYLNLPRERTCALQLTVDAEDNLYLAIAGDESCVLVLDNTFKLKRKIGRKGREKGEFQSASGVWVAPDGKVYVTDALGTALQVFDKDGKFLFGFGDKGFGPMSFGLPSGCVTDKWGNIWVLDGIKGKLAAFDSKGGWLNNLAGPGNAPGDVCYPSYMTGDRIDTIYIAERVGRRIQGIRIFSKEEPAAKADDK